MQGKEIMTVHDVMDVLGIGQSKAYQIIRKLNKELAEKKYITVSGRISRKYFYERVRL